MLAALTTPRTEALKRTFVSAFGDSRLPDRFWSKCIVDPTSDCWLWTAAHYSNGYGVTSVKYRRVSAHRLSYEMLVGVIPYGLEIDHLCRVRCCVNPAHLEAVTRAENNRRMAAAITHCPQGHGYTAENTRVRRGKRECIECVRASCRRRHHARKARKASM